MWGELQAQIDVHVVEGSVLVSTSTLNTMAATSTRVTMGTLAPIGCVVVLE